MIMPEPDGDLIRNTGGQVDDMTMALIDAVHDGEKDVQSIISNSLYDLGKKQPSLVLSSCYSYLKRHPKLSQGHRVLLLKVVERILREKLSDVSAPLASDIIKQACHELTQSKDIVPEWQSAASGVLVALGNKYCSDVMESMLQKFQPGVLPHYFVIQTMANLASANVYAMVPHLKAVLGTMLPMFGMAKHDNIRWVFSMALCKFSEAIVEYLANIDKAPDPTVCKDMYSGEIFAAYDILFNVWLQSKEAKLRLTIVETLGHMTHLMARDKLEEQLPRLLHGLLGMYRKHPEPLHITQGLCLCLDAICQHGNLILEPYLDNLFNVLFPQVCQSADYRNPQMVKNQNEVFRCLTVIAHCFSAKLIGLLLGKLENGNEKVRLGCLSVFKHLINAASDHMEDKKEVLLSGLKMSLYDSNHKVKKMFAQVVIAMAHHEYLDLEGGHVMVEFIVRQCSLPPDPQCKKSPDPENVTNDDLRLMCDNILHLVTTTIDHMEEVLWPYLLELVVVDAYTDSIKTVCKNLAYLAKKKRDENAEDFEFDYETQVNLPRPHVLIARLMVLAGRPTNGRQRGTAVLHVMQHLSPNLHESLVNIWDTVIPKLIQYYEDCFENEDEDNKEKWSQKNWEDLLLKMLSKSLDEIEDEEWVVELGKTFDQQIPFYSNMPDEKNFLFKCMGIVLRKSTMKEFVSAQLDIIFSNVKHSSQVEREGCAVALGFCASSHLDLVLTKLESVTRQDLGKKSGGLLGFMTKEKSDGGSELVKATLMLCYGFVSLYSPPSLLISRMEATILRTIKPYFANTKDTVVKQNLIRAMTLVAQSLHPQHLQQVYSFSSRAEFLTHLQSYIRTENTASLVNETRALTLHACTELLKLQPKVADADMFDLIKTMTDALYVLPADGVSLKRPKEECYTDLLESEVLMEATFEALHEMFEQCLLNDMSPTGLEMIFKMFCAPKAKELALPGGSPDEQVPHLVPWLLSVNEHERKRAMNTCLVITRFYLDHMLTDTIQAAACFNNFGVILARVLPRCSDPCLETRQNGIDTVHTLLRIELRYQGIPVDCVDAMVDALPTLKDRVIQSDSSVLYSVINDLAKVIAKKLPCDQLQSFLETLFEGLLDTQSHSSSGTCVLLNGMLKARGGEVIAKVDHLIEVLHQKLYIIQCPQTKTGTLRSIRTLASHHLTPVITTLLNYPLPLDSELVEIWQILSQDNLLLTSILEHLLDLLQRGLPYEEKLKADKSAPPQRTAMHLPLAATCALTEIFRVEEAEEQVKKVYHRLFAALLVRVGVTIGVMSPKPTTKDDRPSKLKKGNSPAHATSKTTPCSMAVDSLREFFIRAGSQAVIDIMDTDDCWMQLQSEEEYADAVTVLARAIATHESDQVSQIVASLTTSLSSLYDCQRVVAAAFFSELINQKCVGDSMLVELLMNSLLGRLVDSSQQVRMLCVRGLGNVASMGVEQVQKYTTTVLSAMMAGMDDKEDPEDDITLEAMSGLSKVLSQIEETHIRAILINVALKIRPCLEKDLFNRLLQMPMSGPGLFGGEGCLYLQQTVNLVNNQRMVCEQFEVLCRERVCTAPPAFHPQQARGGGVLVRGQPPTHGHFLRSGEKTSVRAQAFTLFGNLSRFGDGPSKLPFLEQIHSNLISVLLHLNDPEVDVRKACKYSLRLLGPLLASELVNSKFQKHLLEDANLFYGEFMNDLAKAIIQDFTDKVNFYVMGCVSFFKSNWPEIKANAAMFAGFLLGNLPREKQMQISKEHVCSALILLLKDSSADVRIKAAEAMSLLHDY